MAKEINELREEVSRLGSEIAQIKKRLNEFSMKEPVKKVVKEEVEKAKEEHKQVHPRQGNYESEDVAIEKFFYFGKR